MASVYHYNFGVGGLWLIPSGASPTPVQVGILTDISVDISYDMKELYGSNQFPIDVAKGKAKVTGKAKNAQISSGLLLSAVAGGTVTTGQKFGIVGENGTIPATPYQVTVANSANFVDDLGVIDFNTGKIMSRVASSPATGQYSVAAGVYTFAAADTTHAVSINYSYSATTGKTVSLSNQLMGQDTSFILQAHNTYRSKGFGWKFYSVHIPKLGFNLKSEAYTEQDLDFTATQDATSSKVFDVFMDE